MSTSNAAAPKAKPIASRLSLPLAGVVGAMALIAIGALVAGRRDEQLPQVYGRRRGGEGVRSVNGTAVLAEYFKRAGHRVTTLGRLSPRLNEADVIVWAPDNFAAPSQKEREFLEKWLARDKNKTKTLVYIGRDYDAAVDYWKDWQELTVNLPASQADEGLRRRSEARAQFEAARAKMPENDYARWFTTYRDAPPTVVKQLSGPWAEGIDARQAAIEVDGRLLIPSTGDRPASDPPFPDNFDVLLSAQDIPLVTRVTNDVAKNGWGKGQILVVANGGFLLNYPLMNTERRKLAARLVNECSAAGQVVFVESGPGAVTVLEKEPAGGSPSALELLKVWPLNVILLHLAILGIIYCLARSPIFGRPMELLPDSPADFGKHVAALGGLLARTKNRNYAQTRLAHYRQLAQRKSGRTHRTGPAVSP